MDIFRGVRRFATVLQKKPQGSFKQEHGGMICILEILFTWPCGDGTIVGLS